MDTERLSRFRDLDGARLGLTLAEGLLLSRRLVASGLALEGVYCLGDYEPEFVDLTEGRCPVVVLSQKEMEAWAGFAFHRGVIAVARRPRPRTLESWLEEHPQAVRLAAAPGLTDPENLGSVFRSALAMGWNAVVLGPSSCDPWSRRCAKVSMGAIYQSPPVWVESPEQAKRLLAPRGWKNVAMSLEVGAQDLESWMNSPEGVAWPLGRLALWLGNEALGLGAWRQACDRALLISMEDGYDSLNAAMAAGIFYYRLRRSRG